MTVMQEWVTAQDSPEIPVNENFDTLGYAAVYGYNPATSSGLTWGYYGGRWGGFAVTASSLTLTDASTNYIVVLRSTGVISTSTTTTNWNNTTDYARVYRVVTAGGVVTNLYDTDFDYRAGDGGIFGSSGGGGGGSSTSIPQNSQSAAYELVLSDAGKHIFHPSADTTARTWTIPANSSVAFDVGTVVTFVNQNGAGVITIAITTDTMRLAGAGTTGSRTLAANGIATAIKVTSTEWLISGTGLT
jgi:hypothetical protein